MATLTIAGPIATVVPKPLSGTMIHVRRNWSDAWELRHDLEPLRASVACSGQDLGSFEFLQRFGGGVKHPHQTAFRDPFPQDLTNYWVRVSFTSDIGPVQQWLGRVAGEARAVHGRSTDASGAAVPGGAHTWVAYEPLQMLRRISLSESYWLVDGSFRRLGWIPAMNVRDRYRRLIGNRSSTMVDISEDDDRQTYCYGGTELWSRYDALQYLLWRFADDSENDGPEWFIEGPAVELLKQSKDIIEFGATQTLAEAIRLIVNPSIGLDYTIVTRFVTLAGGATADGLAVRVFPLESEAVSFRGVTLPKNPDQIRIKTTDRQLAENPTIVRSNDQRFDRIRLLGERIVVCCTLRAGIDSSATLEGQWTQALEDAYAAIESDVDVSADQVRAALGDTFRSVFQLFGVPEDWDHQTGEASPQMTGDGELEIPTSSTPDAESGNWQSKVRATLAYLPLREGVRYEVTPNVDENPANVEADFRPPQAWIVDPETGRYVPVDKIGISVSAPQNDWGVFLQANPNHLLALNHFDGDTDTEAKYDYSTLIATIAFEIDQRFSLEWEAPDATPDGGRLDILTGAEAWYLAKDSVVGVDEESGALLTSPAGQVLRNDADRMALVMAGAIARYGRTRARGEASFHGLLPWARFVGQILAVVETAGDSERVGAPITGISWTWGDRPMTTIRTGYAT